MPSSVRSPRSPQCLAAIFCLLLMAVQGLAFAGPDIKHMRAVHAMGNWGGNIQGFAKPLLADAPELVVEQASVQVFRSSYVDAQGVMRTNDLAQVKFTGVKLGSDTSLQLAGFWVHRDVATGNQGIQFLPQLDGNLSGIAGFSGDVYVAVPANDVGQAPYMGDVQALSGDARKLVLAVLAHSPELLQSATYTVDSSAVFGSQASLVTAMAKVRTALDTDKAYFDYLKSLNVEWIGISVAMHYDSYSNPTVAARNCVGGGMPDSGGNWTSCAFRDEDLTSFIGRAKANGFKIFMTLAFETSMNIDSTTSPACGTPAYKMARWLLGLPQLIKGSIPSQCIADTDWWWNPSHPLHVTNVAIFWDSYTQVATKYAALAQQLGVDLYSLGTETDQLFRTRPANAPYSNDFKSQLLDMVAAVRNVYSGLVTYDQHFSVLTHPEWNGGAESSQYLFDDLNLDVVGISAYFELVSAPPQRLMSVTELETQWDRVFSTYLVPLQARYPGKPVVLTEIGYVDDIDAPYDQQSNANKPEPAFDDTHPTVGMLQQQSIYQSFFNVNTRYGDLIAGAFFWGNDYFPYNEWGCKNIDWSVTCRPARKVLAASYEAWRNKDADRIFDWAEATLPQHFPAGSQSMTGAGYYFRYYPATTTYLGYQDDHVFVHNGRDWNLLDVGMFRTYLDRASGAGF